MPRSCSQFNAMKEERKTSILQNALYLFSIRGYDAVKMTDIAEACHCSHGLLYHYYDSKEELFHDLMKKAHETMDKYRLWANDLPTAKERMEAFTDSMITMLKSDDDTPFYFYMLTNFRFQRTLPPPPHYKKEMDQKRITLRQILQKTIEDGQKEKTFYEGNPEQMMLAFHSLLRGSFFEKINTPKKEYICPDAKVLLHLLIKE